MMTRPVAVLDSGIGGLPYLSWLQNNLPQENLVYIADAANFPYGEKTPDQVRSAVVSLGLALVERYQPKLLLVACNTASVLALEALREALPLPVVGVVPAVKTAAALGSGTLAVLATPRTVENDYWETLVAEFAPKRKVKGYAAPDLVKLVEEGAPERDKEELLASWASRLKSDHVDAVVLGCTHYLHLAKDLERHLGPGVTVVDSRHGVGRQVGRVLKDKNLLADCRQGPDLLHFTARTEWTDSRVAELELRYKEWACQFNLTYAGPWFVSAKVHP